MVCTHPTAIYNGDSAVKYRLYGCGKCMPCRIQRTSEWSLRLMNELPYWNYEATFITLTYDEEHLPSDFGLHKEDLQKFFKRLRKDLDYKIKYYACGEYGDKLGRPHYHAIVFGLDYNEFNRQLIKDNWRLCDSERFDYSPYKKSECGFAPVTPDDIRYVCGYIQKKLNGDMAQETYGERQPPFSASSQGLGLRFAESHKEELQNGEVTFRGHNVSIPRYYVKKLDLKFDSITAYDRKLEYCNNHGYSFDGSVPKALLESAYESCSRSHLEAYDKEINARYSME